MRVVSTEAKGGQSVQGGQMFTVLTWSKKRLLLVK